MDLDGFIERSKNSLSALFFTSAVVAESEARDAQLEEDFHLRELKKPKTYGDMHDVALAGLVIAARQRQKAVSHTVLSAALCLESTVNYLLDEKLSRFYINSFDKLEPTAKWLVLMKFVYGRDLDVSASPASDIKTLFTRRNFLAHPKPQPVPVLKRNVPENPPLLPLSWAAESLEAVRRTFRYLDAVDQTASELVAIGAEQRLYMNDQFSEMVRRAQEKFEGYLTEHLRNKTPGVELPKYQDIPLDVSFNREPLRASEAEPETVKVKAKSLRGQRSK